VRANNDVVLAWARVHRPPLGTAGSRYHCIRCVDAPSRQHLPPQLGRMLVFPFGGVDGAASGSESTNLPVQLATLSHERRLTNSSLTSPSAPGHRPSAPPRRTCKMIRDKNDHHHGHDHPSHPAVSPGSSLSTALRPQEGAPVPWSAISYCTAGASPSLASAGGRWALAIIPQRAAQTGGKGHRAKAANDSPTCSPLSPSEGAIVINQTNPHSRLSTA
jgi:hypothetical protein